MGRELYERRKTNPLTLLNDSHIDMDAKALKIGEKKTGLEFSNDKVLFTKEVEITDLNLNKITSNGMFTLHSTVAAGFELTDSRQDDGDYIKFDTSDGVALAIATNDVDGTGGNISLLADGVVSFGSVGGDFDFYKDGSNFVTWDIDANQYTWKNDTNADDYFRLEVGSEGATTISTVDADTTVGHLTLQPDGDLVLDPVSTKIIINATDDLYLDGGGDTYMTESSADVLDINVGGDTVLQLSEAGTEGNLVNMGTSCAGFTQQTITYDADDTSVFFNRGGNKAILTFDSGNITDLHLNFPNVSCNCLLLLVQDGTGSRTITYYKTFDQLGLNESTVSFAGGSNPTLTTTAGKTDILSFYWDNTNHKAYGTITHNF